MIPLCLKQCHPHNQVGVQGQHLSKEGNFLPVDVLSKHVNFNISTMIAGETFLPCPDLPIDFLLSRKGISLLS